MSSRPACPSKVKQKIESQTEKTTFVIESLKVTVCGSPLSETPVLR